MNINSYFIVILLAVTIFSSNMLFNNNFSEIHYINKENNYDSSLNFLQNSYAVEEDDEDDDKDEDEKKNLIKIPVEVQ